MTSWLSLMFRRNRLTIGFSHSTLSFLSVSGAAEAEEEEDRVSSLSSSKGEADSGGGEGVEEEAGVLRAGELAATAADKFAEPARNKHKIFSQER
jgi:hypothetical protein